MTAKVVQLVPRDALFDQAWLSYPLDGRRRSSKLESLPEWRKVAKIISERELMDAVRRFASEDIQHLKEHGTLGFHRWLKLGRWEHWLGASESTLREQRQFPDPQLRARFFERFGEARALRWFDVCDWRPVTREVVSPKGYALREQWIRGPFMDWARANGVSALVMG